MTVEDLKARYPHAVFKEDEYLAKVIAFAEERGLMPKLLKAMEGMAPPTFFGTPCSTNVFADGSPFSFYWEREVNGRLVMNGAMIYYRAGDSGVGAPQYSVRLGDTDAEGWSLHT